MLSEQRTTQLRPVSIGRAGRDQLDELRPLWDSMQEHHASVAPRLARGWQFRSNAASWKRRRASYAQWLEEPGAFLLVARREDHPVGYLFGRPSSGWTVVDTGSRTGAIESLAVLPSERAHGIGHLMMERAHKEFAAIGVETVTLSVLAENAGAIRFYEAHGMVPATITYMGTVAQ